MSVLPSDDAARVYGAIFARFIGPISSGVAVSSRLVFMVFTCPFSGSNKQCACHRLSIPARWEQRTQLMDYPSAERSEWGAYERNHQTPPLRTRASFVPSKEIDGL